MTGKLRAKLSDGTEWEIYNRRGWSGFCAADPTAQYWCVKPIKREPREWYLSFDSNERFNSLHETIPDVVDHTYDMKPPFRFVKVREVLE